MTTRFVLTWGSGLLAMLSIKPGRLGPGHSISSEGTDDAVVRVTRRQALGVMGEALGANTEANPQGGVRGPGLGLCIPPPLLQVTPGEGSVRAALWQM